jgi:putative transcriptional regulator
MNYEFLNIGKQEPVKCGSLLLMEPFSDDPNFKRSVILMCDCGDEGSFGFVLNQALGLDVHSIIDGIPVFDQWKIGSGGPVAKDQLFFLHDLKSLEGAMHITNDIYLGGNLSALNDEEFSAKKFKIAFYVGYAGWSENQLSEEIAELSWIVSNNPISMDTLFFQQEDLWKNQMALKGKRYQLMSQFPINFENN